jgi:hypothetical protein
MRRIATTLGVAMAAFVALLVPASAGATSFGQVATFGGSGSGQGQFDHPQAADVDSMGRIYVAESTPNARVQRLSPIDGSFQTQYAPSPPSAMGYSPQDVAVVAGFVYVASPHRVDVFNAGTGIQVASWVPQGTAYGIAVNTTAVYVADTENSQVVAYNALTGMPTGLVIGGPASESGQLSHPRGMTIGADGLLYVADPENQRIAVFDPSDGSVKPSLVLPNYIVNAGGQTFNGTVNPNDVAESGTGADTKVYLPDSGVHSNLVVVLGSNGVEQYWGAPDSDPSNPCKVVTPWGVAASLDASPILYVVSTGEDMIRQYDEADTTTPCPAPSFGSGGAPPTTPAPTQSSGPVNDVSKPQIRFTGFPRHCARRNFAFTVHLQDDVLVSRMTLLVNGKRAASNAIGRQSFDFRVNIPVRKVRRQIPHGFSVRILITVKAVDSSGKKAKKSKAFSICG